MARFTIASAVLALASVVSAQTPNYDSINKPGNGEIVQAGTTYTITWTPAAGYNDDKVILALIGGQTQGTQVPLYTIGSAANSAGQLAWNVDCAYSGEPFYGLTITNSTDSGIFQYSNPFKIVSSDSCSSSSMSTGPTSSATVTATLSSVSSHSTTTTNGTVTVTSSCSTSTYPTTTLVPNYNNTMTSKNPVVVTATSYSTANGTAAVSSHPSTVVTSGATRVGGSIVMLAGVAAAFFVL